MCPHVSLELVGVSAGVAAKAALEGPFPRVGPDVSFQLAHLDRGGRAVQKRGCESFWKGRRPKHAGAGGRPTSTLQ